MAADRFRRLTWKVAPALVLLLLAPAGGSSAAPGTGPAAEVRVRTELAADGDLAFRRGRSLVSRAVLAGDRGGDFSHVGVVVLRDGQPWVVHSVPPGDGDPGGVKLEPLSAFLAPENASAAALYRLRGGLPAAAREAIVRRVLGWAEQGVPFDGGLDLTTSEALYCTELVWRAYLDAGYDLVPVPRVVSLAGSRREVLMPSQFAAGSLVEPVPDFVIR